MLDMTKLGFEPLAQEARNRDREAVGTVLGYRA